MRILLAEDDSSQADSIKTWLEMDGYNVDWVSQGDHAILAVDQHDYDCILLDRGLPKLLGDDVLQSIRSKKKLTPIILITAKDTIQDRVDGLDLGANDYLVKPFSLEELSARIRAQLRQHQPLQSDIIYYANLALDTQKKLLSKSEQVIHLTAKEYQIIYKLMLKPEQIITREQLEEALYAWGDEVESNAVEVFIYQLRKKIGSDYIKTIRGLGYRMNQVQ